jgi:hypothetical protein
MKRDEIFRVLQKCAAEMSVATRRLYHLSLVQGDFGITSNVIPQYASSLRHSQVDCGFEMDTEALAWPPAQSRMLPRCVALGLTAAWTCRRRC